MTSAKIKNYFLRLLTGIFLVATLAAFFPFNQVHAADAQMVSGGCAGNGVTTGYSSPFSKTPDMCLGGTDGTQYYQFAVKFPSAITGGSVTGKTADGVNIPFVSQSNQLYVSTPTSKLAGYQGSVGTLQTKCNNNDKTLQIMLTAKGNGDTQTLPTINLCDHFGASNSLIYVTANEIGDSTGDTSGNTGTIKGNIGIFREDPLVPAGIKTGTLERLGVNSIKLTGPETKSGTRAIDDADSWYSLVGGKLVIANLKPGTGYTLTIDYTDKPVIQNLSAPGDPSWTTDALELTFPNITVPPGGDVWIPKGASDTNIIYYNAEGQVVDPNKLPVTSAKSCVIDGIGWLICGFTSFIADVADNVYSLIENILKVPVINTDTGSGTNGVYNAWTIMRNLANIVFVIMFLIIIFAQLTGQGVSNYGVKKTLPRLVVAAILVNVSFWLSAIVVDLSNIIGAGLYQLLRGVVNSMNVGISTNWANLMQALMGGTTLAGGAAAVGVAGTVAAASIPGIGGALLFLAIPLVLGAMLAVLAVVVILIARQALVIILIIVSPLAFVALLLPNTESLFKRWRTTLTSLLLMYPIVSIIFGGAQVAGFAILSTASTTKDPLTTWIAIITGQFVIVAPFFFLPTILIKFSGGNLDKLAATIQNRGQKLIGGISNASRSAGNARLGRGFNRAKYGQDNGAGGVRNSFRRAIGAGGRLFDQRRDGNKLADNYLAEEHQKATNERLGTDAAYATRIAGGNVGEGQRIASRAIAAAEAEELKRALEPLRRTLASKNGDDQKKYLQSEISKGGTNALAALHYAAQSSRTDLLRSGTKSTDPNIQRMTNEAIQANVASVMGKAPALVKGAKGAFGSVKAQDMATWDETTAQEFADHMKSITDPAELKTATDAFNVAINNLADTASLKSTFSTETAKKLQSAIVANPNLASTLVTNRIGPDGGLT